jgi:hypothetical protein
MVGRVREGGCGSSWVPVTSGRSNQPENACTTSVKLRTRDTTRRQSQGQYNTTTTTIDHSLEPYSTKLYQSIDLFHQAEAIATPICLSFGRRNTIAFDSLTKRTSSREEDSLGAFCLDFGDVVPL